MAVIDSERTTWELMVLQAQHWGDREFTPKEMQAAIGLKVGKVGGHITGALSALYYAGVLDRRYVQKIAGYRYRWLGAGPGGVQ